MINAIYPDTKDLTSVSKIRVEFLKNLSGRKDLNSGNTVIVGVLGESPYAEFMGDINNKYCYNTVKFVEGCLYNFHINDYLPD